jgi:hypothetical protein
VLYRGDGALEGAQEVAVESGHRRGAAAAAGTDGLEASQFPGVSGDRRQAGAAVQLQPLEELGDRLGERDRGCGRLGHPRVLSPSLEQSAQTT